VNARQKKKLLRRFLNLIGNHELNEKDYDELVQKLETELEKRDGAVIELMEKLNKIYKNSNRRNNKIKAAGIVIEEFIAKIIAETITRETRGY